MVFEFLPDAGLEWQTAGLGTSMHRLLGPSTPAHPNAKALEVQTKPEGNFAFNGCLREELVTDCESIAPSSCMVVHAEWNAATPGEVVEGDLVLGDDFDEHHDASICSVPALQERPPPAKLAVLLKRGGSSGTQKFVELASWAKKVVEGAALVVIANDDRPEPVSLAYVANTSDDISSSSDDDDVPLPTVLLSKEDGCALWHRLELGEKLHVQVRCPGVAASPFFPALPRAVVAAPGGCPIYVADMGSHCVWQCYEEEASFVLAGIRGERGGEPFCDRGLAHEIKLEYPHDLALDSDGLKLYICESYAVRCIDLQAAPANLSTILRSDMGLGGIALGSHSRLLVSEHSQHQIIEVDTQSQIRTRIVAGTGLPGPLQSGILAHHARLNNPSKLAVTPTEDVIFVDAGNRALRIIESSSGVIHTLSDAIDAPDGLAICPQIGIAAGGTVLVSEGRSHQVIQFRPDGNGPAIDLGSVCWKWSTCAGTGEGVAVNNEVCDNNQGSAIHARLQRPLGLTWVAGLGLLVCDEPQRAVQLVRALTPWAWRGQVLLLRKLTEQGRAAIKGDSLSGENAGHHGALHNALNILMKLPDEEFREVISWWSVL